MFLFIYRNIAIFFNSFLSKRLVLCWSWGLYFHVNLSFETNNTLQYLKNQSHTFSTNNKKHTHTVPPFNVNIVYKSPSRLAIFPPYCTSMSELMNFICPDSPYVSFFSPFNPFFSWFLMLPNIVCFHFCVSEKEWLILRTVFMGLHFSWNETKTVFNKCFLILFAFSLHPLFGINAWFSSWREISNVNSTLCHDSFGGIIHSAG